MLINIECDSVEITPADSRNINVELSGVAIADFIAQFGEQKILDAIGQKKAADHFGLTAE